MRHSGHSPRPSQGTGWLEPVPTAAAGKGCPSALALWHQNPERRGSFGTGTVRSLGINAKGFCGRKGPLGLPTPQKREFLPLEDAS